MAGDGLVLILRTRQALPLGRVRCVGAVRAGRARGLWVAYFYAVLCSILVERTPAQFPGTMHDIVQQNRRTSLRSHMRGPHAERPRRVRWTLRTLRHLHTARNRGCHRVGGRAGRGGKLARRSDVLARNASQVVECGHRRSVHVLPKAAGRKWFAFDCVDTGRVSLTECALGAVSVRGAGGHRYNVAARGTVPQLLAGPSLVYQRSALELADRTFFRCGAGAVRGGRRLGSLDLAPARIAARMRHAA